MEKAEDVNTLTEILEANHDLESRLKSELLSVTYDDEFDIFMVTIGDPRPCATEDVADGLQIRYDPQSLKVSAFEILGFRNRYLKKHPEFLENYQALHPSSPPYYTPQGPAREAARKLIPA